MVWPIMGDACRRSIHLKDGVEASQRVRSSGRSAPSSTLAFNEQSGNCSGPEVGFGATTPSGEFQSEVVVYGLAEFLLAAKIAFSCLNGCMPQQRLNLLKFSAR